MKTKIYWMIQHNRRTAHDLRFRVRCSWLSQQESYLGWRLRLEALLPDAPAVRPRRISIPANVVAKKGTHVYTGAV